MGTIKNSKIKEAKEFDVSEFDINFIKALNQGAISSYNYYRNLVARYLSGMAGKQWGYPPDAVLDFEISEKDMKIKVTPATLDKK